MGPRCKWLKLEKGVNGHLGGHVSLGPDQDQPRTAVMKGRFTLLASSRGGINCPVLAYDYKSRRSSGTHVTSCRHGSAGSLRARDTTVPKKSSHYCHRTVAYQAFTGSRASMARHDGIGGQLSRRAWGSGTKLRHSVAMPRCFSPVESPHQPADAAARHLGGEAGNKPR